MKILFTATVQSHICQFHLPFIEMLKKQGHEVHVAAKNNLDVKPGLKLDIADKVYDVPFERSPFSTQNIKAYKVLKKIMEENQYGMVHCNTPMGGVVTRLAANRKKTKVVYTAHGFHFFKGAPLKNWLMYYPMEWVLAFKTDVLICINKEDFTLAEKHMHAKRVEYVPGVGINLEKFTHGNTTAEELENLKKSLGILEENKMLFSIGELSERKNHKCVLTALAKLNDKNIKYFICGNGPLCDYLKQLISDLGLEDQVQLLGYRRDIPALCDCADLFAFSSLQEGLPVALMEAMAMGVPCVASKIRGNEDLIENEKNGILVDARDSTAFAEAINKLLYSEELRKTFVDAGFKKIKEFSLDNVKRMMQNIYAQI